jgi:hypothetical protein
VSNQAGVPKVRNWNAVAAWFRNGGPMKHKNTPRGGARNDSRDLVDQGREEMEDDTRLNSTEEEK